MKRLLLTLSIVFVLTACDDGGVDDNGGMNKETETNPFVGTWEAANGYYSIFTKTNITSYKPDNTINWKGAYTYDDTHVTIYLDIEASDPDIVESWGNTHLMQYVFQDNKLYFGTWLEKIQ